LELALRGECNSAVCINRWIAGICILPSLLWFIVTIRHYDQELQDKKRNRQIEVNNLIETHNKQAEEMNECCRQITENANDFAQGRFNDKATAFIRFLRNVPRDVEVYSDQEMLDELRHFVIMWFHTFSGALLNPESNPVWGNVEQEMRNCITVQDLCEAATKKVKSVGVAFKCQVQADIPLLEQRDSTERSSSSAGVVDLEGNVDRKCGVTWLKFHRCGKPTRLFHNAPVTYAEMRQAHQHLEEPELRAEWQGLRRLQGCGIQRSPSDNGMPFEILFCFGKVRVLSGMHAKFLFLFFGDAALLVFEAANLRWISFLLIAINEICAISVLACFEQINEIAVLDREINFFRERVTEVQQKHDKAKRDWDQVKQLHELWKYRTLPTLSVMEKVTFHLEDKVSRTHSGDAIEDGYDTSAEFLRHANQSIDCLDIKLGSLESWRARDTPLDEEWKETIGRQLRACEHTEDLIGTLDKLPIITTDLSLLDAAPPASSPRTSFSSTSGVIPPGPATTYSPPGSFTGSFHSSGSFTERVPASKASPRPSLGRVRAGSN